MDRPHDDLLDRWLRAEDEDEGEDGAADAALTALFAALPLQAAPAPGFADRVVARARPALKVRVAAHLYAFLASPWGRASVALGLAAAALGLLVLAGLFRPALGLLRPALLVPLAAHALVLGAAWLASCLRLGQWLVAFAHTLMAPFESPAVAAVLGACLLVPALALRLLYDLIQRERWTHANPI